jgi:hypothetical protein
MPSQGHFGQHMKFSIGRLRIHRAFASSQRKHLDHVTCRPLQSFSTRSDPVSARRASGLGFLAKLSNPDGFMVNRRKPHGLSTASTPIPLMTWPPHLPGQTNKISCSTLWSNRGTRQISGEPQKTPHASFDLTTPSIGPAKPFTSGSQTVYSILPRSIIRLLPCTGSYP